MTGRRGWSAGQWAVRLPILLGPVAAVLATGGAGNWPAPWLVVVVALLAAYFASSPESSVGTGVLCLVVAWWGVGLRDGLSVWALPAAAALLVAHLAALVASYGPDAAPIPGVLARRWAWRGLCVLYPAPLVLFLVVGLRDQPPPPGIWLAGLAAALLAIAGGGVAFSLVRGELPAD